MEPATAAVETAMSAEGERLFDLFRRPHGRSRPRPDETAVMESAVTGSVTVGGKRAVTYRWGTGARPVLLVHGWESRASRYAKAVARLVEAGCSPVAFDAPGHGESEGQDTTLVEYRDIIARLQREHGEFEAVVAHSFGALAVFFALGEGLRARRVVAVSPVPDFSYLIETFQRRMRLPAPLEDELRHRVERQLYPDVADMWTRFSVLHDADAVRAPLLFVHDEDDEAVEPGRVAQLVGAFGGRASLVTTRRFGHRRILGAPQAVDAMTEFIEAGAARAGRETEVGAR
ncbi:alpha/beta hydrolase family protein [Streptomyces sp. NPDC015220]|uniref:alpha/beta hydrolase family protein n=1 Tax=Streptomyces sp. NPDC015220 TaxID=3364947 RepID=UPI0036FF8028